MTLDDDMYLEILDRVDFRHDKNRVDFRHDKKRMINLLREWDEARTRVNPNATWYYFKKPKSTTVNRKDVIAILTDVSKDIHTTTSESYQDILETLIEVEYRINRLNGGDDE